MTPLIIVTCLLIILQQTHKIKRCRHLYCQYFFNENNDVIIGIIIFSCLGKNATETFSDLKAVYGNQWLFWYPMHGLIRRFIRFRLTEDRVVRNEKNNRKMYVTR